MEPELNAPEGLRGDYYGGAILALTEACRLPEVAVAAEDPSDILYYILRTARDEYHAALRRGPSEATPTERLAWASLGATETLDAVLDSLDTSRSDAAADVRALRAEYIARQPSCTERLRPLRAETLAVISRMGGGAGDE